MLLNADDDAAIATNIDFSGAQHTSFQSRLDDTVCNVQFIPSDDVMTFLFSPRESKPPTATNNDFSGAQHTPCQFLSAGGVRTIHVLVASIASA